MNPLLGIFYVFNQQEGDQGAGGGSAKKIHTILKQNEAAADIMAAMWIDGLFKRPGKAVKRKFTTTQAQELVNLCKKYGGTMDIKAVFKKYSQTIHKEGDLEEMSDFLQSFESMLESELKQTSTQKDKNALNVDRENQLVVKKTEVEEDKNVLRGRAREAENKPKDTHIQRLEGLFLLETASNFTFPKGTTIQINFNGTVGGKVATFSGIKAEITHTTFLKKNSKYVEAKIVVNQVVTIKNSKTKIFISADEKSFNVKIK